MSSRPVNLYYFCAKGDEPLFEGLRKHLALLRRLGLVDDWGVDQSPAGSNFALEEHAHFFNADIILLLISANFIDHRHIWEGHLWHAMEKHIAGKTRVIPIILSPVDFEGAPFQMLQTLPRNGKPIALWANQDEAWTEVAQAIRQAVKDFSLANKD